MKRNDGRIRTSHGGNLPLPADSPHADPPTPKRSRRPIANAAAGGRAGGRRPADRLRRRHRQRRRVRQGRRPALRRLHPRARHRLRGRSDRPGTIAAQAGGRRRARPTRLPRLLQVRPLVRGLGRTGAAGLLDAGQARAKPQPPSASAPARHLPSARPRSRETSPRCRRRSQGKRRRRLHRRARAAEPRRRCAQRLLPQRTGLHDGRRGGHARGVQGDHRRRPHPSGRRAGVRDHLDVLSGLERRASTASYLEFCVEVINHALDGLPEEQVRFHMLLGQRPPPAHQRHRVQAHRRPAAEDQRAGVRLRGRQRPPRARVARVGGRASCRRARSSMPGRRRPRHRSGRASGAGRRAPRATTPSSSGMENVQAGTDCGIGSRVGHEEIVWAKLRSLGEGARIASERLWG